MTGPREFERVRHDRTLAAMRLSFCATRKAVRLRDGGLDALKHVGSPARINATFGSTDPTDRGRVWVVPSEAYEDLVSALAEHLGIDVFARRHGWPVLSVGGRNPTVTEGEGAGNALPGGAA